MDTWILELRHAFRVLERKPLFTAIAAGSLAIGIGANTALFGVANVLLLEPLPGITGWDRAVELGRGQNGRGFDTFTYPDLGDLAASVPALEEVAGWSMASFSVGAEEGSLRRQGMHVGVNYFRALGVEPALGRFFTADEAGPDAGVRSVVVSDRFWRERMEGRPDAVGSTIRVNRRPFTVVGVTPPGFAGHLVGLRHDFFLPMSAMVELGTRTAETFDHRGSSWVMAVGRLADEATVEQADAQVSALFERLQESYPTTHRNRTASVVPLGPVPGGGRTAVLGFVWVLGAMVGLVLLVTCSNVAGMLLARAAAREREIAVRLALGAGRGRMVRHLLTEALLVFAVGGIGGVALAWWGMGLVDAGALPIPADIALDFRPDLLVLALGLAVTLVTGVVFGLAPALHGMRTDLVRGLKADPGGGGRTGSRLRRAFASAQVGFSLVLLVAAGLFLRSLQLAADVDRGFRAEGAYATSLDLELEGYDEATGIAFFERLVDRLEARPAIRSTAVSTDLPLDLGSHGTSIALPGREEPVGVEFNQVTPGYFETLGMRLLQGRAFTDDDRAGAEEVAIVSRSLAETVWPGEEALGRSFDFLLAGSPTVTVVGVVDDVPNQTLMSESTPMVYRPVAQQYGPTAQVVVRSDQAYAEVVSAVRETILSLDPRIALDRVVRLEELTSVGILPQRIGASVASALGAIALLLAGLGVYGVVAFLVAGRTREIGVRMALGAGRRRIVAGVIGGALRMALPGLAVGAVVAGLLARLLASQNVLLGLPAADPVVIVAVAGALVGVVLLAGAVPARRAASVAPSRALRYD